MSEYQVIARKYRPKSFAEVLGQDNLVKTLRNAIKFNRLAHAYIFCGSRGTGKTTLARIFAKALNCQNPTVDFEPCNLCSTCKEITAGHSLDVLEIDGASNRGIDDIRQINDTVSYVSSSGKYKIYIIDEVHMLTKEAFNALLKTLEEPPSKVIFLFATTEPHKVLPTILSRCQRFNVNRIPNEIVVKKLTYVAQDLKLNIQEEALFLIATMADGGLRDAESLLDQIIAFQEGEITTESVSLILGIMPRDCFFELDRAGKEGHLAIAFDIAHQVFSQGKDLTHFIEGLIEHFRTLLIIKILGKDAPSLSLSLRDKEKYILSAKLYSQEQCLSNLDFLIEAQSQMRFSSSGRIALEAILLRLMRSHQRLPIEFLVRRLSELENEIGVTKNVHQPQSSPLQTPVSLDSAKPVPSMMQSLVRQSSPLNEDPTPSLEDLGIKKKVTVDLAPLTQQKKTFVEEKQSAPIELGARPTEEALNATIKQQSRYDTLMHFASVELEGTLQKQRK
jgi:DNA polymerase-3 subunit gamma/tau